jgi:hypothetical protein
MLLTLRRLKTQGPTIQCCAESLYPEVIDYVVLMA